MYIYTQIHICSSYKKTNTQQRELQGLQVQYNTTLYSLGSHKLPLPKTHGLQVVAY